MEFRLDKRYALPVGLDAAWAVLSDVRATAACLPGASITEQVDDTHYKGLVKTKVGPAMMNFAGEVEVLALDAGEHQLQMVGKGADKAGSAASMKLSARLEPGDSAGSSTLVGEATVSVSGKLAQFGSRLLVPVSDAMLAQFVANFGQAAAALQAAQTAPAGPATPDAAGNPTEAPLPPAAAPPPPRELNALGLLWTVFKRWLAGLFGRRG